MHTPHPPHSTDTATAGLANPSHAPPSLPLLQPAAPSEGGQTSSDIQQALLPKPPTYQHPISTWRRRYTVVLVAVIAALLSADQNLLAPNLSAAAAYFGLDDFEKDTYLGGYLMAAFFLVGAPSALLCGYFADRFNRIHMLAFIVAVGEAPCLCTYWVTELWQFFLVRMLTGVSVGGCFPLVFSLLGDLFPVSQRAAMSSIVQIAIGGGIGGGQMVAGLLGPAYNWRLPFVVMAAPTLVLALLMVTTVEEPPRGGFERALEGQLAAGAAYSESITWAKVWGLMRVPSNMIIVLQGIFGCLPWGVIQTYITDYLHQQKGLSVELATTVILVFGVGSAVGVVAGGAAGQMLYNWRRPSMAVLTGVSVLVGAAPVLWLINADIQQAGIGAALFMAALAGCFASIAGPNLRAIMINVNPPETRGVALALQSVTADVGKGLGPVIVAGFISRLGRTGAFNLSICGWFPCGAMLASLACTMTHDEDGMQDRLAERSVQVLHSVQVDSSFRPGSPSAGATGSSSSEGATPTPTPGFEPGTGFTSGSEAGPAPSSKWQGKLHVQPVLSRVLGQGGKVAPVKIDSAPGGVEGLQGSAGLGALSPGDGGGGRESVTVPVLAQAESGSVELQQLLSEVAGIPSSSRHAPQHASHLQQQQQQQQQLGWVGLQDCGDARSPTGQQDIQQQQQQQQPTGLEQQVHAPHSSGSGDAVVHLQQSCTDGSFLVPPAASAAGGGGARHRTGHKLQGGGHGSGSGSGSGGSCGRALGEGAEDSWWQPHVSPAVVMGKQGLTVA